MSGFAPDHLGAEVRASANFGPRRGDARPDMILLHYTGMESGAAAEDWLCSPESAVSSHYIVHEDGRIVQMVREADRAWHAGRSFWHGVTDINSCSVGIEIANPGHELGYPDFPEAQIEAVIALGRDIRDRYAVARERVLAHSDVAPDRKRDPGEKFPWKRLAGAGIGHFVAARSLSGSAAGRIVNGSAHVEELQAMLARYGYRLDVTGVYDEPTRAVVAAFQRHFRPEKVDGAADAAVLETLRHLLEMTAG